MTGCSGVAGRPISRTPPSNSLSLRAFGRACNAALIEASKWLTSRGAVLTRGASRRLRVAETVSLGEKRFVAILQVDGEQLLVGGSSSNIVLLAKLEAKRETSGVESFEGVLSNVASGVRGSGAHTESPDGVTR